MDKSTLSDLCDLFIAPAIERVRWDPLTQIRAEVTLTPGPLVEAVEALVSALRIQAG
jgi:type I restriction enzyme, R subunit